MDGISVNKFSFTEAEIQQVEKSLNLNFSEKDRELLMAGRFTDLLELPGSKNENIKKQAKMHLFREKNGEVYVTCNYKKETLFIPDEIEGQKISLEQKQKLADGQTIQLKNSSNQNLYIQVDKDLNAIVVKGDREIGIPEIIGSNKKHGFDGYVLTDRDKSKIANGGILEPKVLCGDMGYFLANFSLSDDQKGYVFYDYQTIPDNKVEEFINKYNNPGNKTNEISEKQEQNLSPEANPEKERVTRNLDNEFTQALNKHDFEKLNQLASEGYKPADIQIQNIETISGLSENEKIAVKTIFKLDEDTPSLQPEEKKKKGKDIAVKKEDDKTNIQLQSKEGKKIEGRTVEKIGHVLNQSFSQM